MADTRPQIKVRVSDSDKEIIEMMAERYSVPLSWIVEILVDEALDAPELAMAERVAKIKDTRSLDYQQWHTRKQRRRIAAT